MVFSKMKNLNTYEQFLFEESISELKLTSAGVKELLSAIYNNWDKLEKDIRNDLGFRTFKDVIYDIRSGGLDTQLEIEDWVKSKGIKVDH
jgi:hypothetical protein